MTRSAIATFICNKLTLLDATSLALCKGFVSARYQMIANSFPWQDATQPSLVGIDAGVNAIPLPEGMNRVFSVRSNDDTFLEPVTANLLMQTDPTIFERTGLPTVYLENYERGEGIRQITVYPIPTTTLTLLIVGKQTLPDLGDGDESVIRNIDQALIAYGTYDMLQRARQWDKAKEALAEANALLQAAKDQETNQGNQPRRAKQLTVAGNSLAELTDAVCARTGEWGLDSIVLIKDFLRRQYQRVWDACPWSEATVMARVNSDGAVIVLPVYFDRVLGVRVDASLGQLSALEPSYLYGIAPSIFEQTGSALGFSYLTSVGVGILPPTREKLSFYSSFATDIGNVFVMGEVFGSEVSESVELQGAIPVTTQNEYDTPLTVSKGLTRGDVVVTGHTTGQQLERILAGERERKHIRLFLHPTPPATVCLILGKRRIKPLVQAEDCPLLRDIQDVLISAACGDMFAKAGNDKAAKDAREQANTALKTLIDLEINQGSYSACVVPDTEPCYAGYDNGFVSK